MLPPGTIPAAKMLPHDVPVDIICTPTQVQWAGCCCVYRAFEAVQVAMQALEERLLCPGAQLVIGGATARHCVVHAALHRIGINQ